MLAEVVREALLKEKDFYISLFCTMVVDKIRWFMKAEEPGHPVFLYEYRVEKMYFYRVKANAVKRKDLNTPIKDILDDYLFLYELHEAVPPEKELFVVARKLREVFDDVWRKIVTAVIERKADETDESLGEKEPARYFKKLQTIMETGLGWSAFVPMEMPLKELLRRGSFIYTGSNVDYKRIRLLYDRLDNFERAIVERTLPDDNPDLMMLSNISVAATAYTKAFCYYTDRLIDFSRKLIEEGAYRNRSFENIFRNSVWTAPLAKEVVLYSAREAFAVLNGGGADTGRLMEMPAKAIRLLNYSKGFYVLQRALDECPEELYMELLWIHENHGDVATLMDFLWKHYSQNYDELKEVFDKTAMCDSEHLIDFHYFLQGRSLLDPKTSEDIKTCIEEGLETDRLCSCFRQYLASADTREWKVDYEAAITEKPIEGKAFIAYTKMTLSD